MSRIPISAGNWKMNGTSAEAVVLADDLRELASIADVEIVLAPSFLQLAPVAEKFRHTAVRVAGQNMHARESGAFTGEVSVSQLRELATWVILGHSERRQFFCEDDEALKEKVQAALDHGLRVILCVGERLEERENNRTDAVLSRQIRGALEGLEIPVDFVIAYEPVWAIGTGQAASAEQAQEACARIRALVAEIAGPAAGDGVRILYGGSVNAGNVSDFIAQPDIDGALVGGASLKAESFLAITRAIASGGA